eukprot:scaffold171494_cov18-Prasinocladus_malaysianus.AAC.1
MLQVARKQATQHITYKTYTYIGIILSSNIVINSNYIPVPAKLAGKEHAYDPGGRGIETRPNQTSTTCARTCKTPGLSCADRTSTSDVWRALKAAPRLSAS